MYVCMVVCFSAFAVLKFAQYLFQCWDVIQMYCRAVWSSQYVFLLSGWKDIKCELAVVDIYVVWYKGALVSLYVRFFKDQMIKMLLIHFDIKYEQIPCLVSLEASPVLVGKSVSLVLMSRLTGHIFIQFSWFLGDTLL